MGAESGQAVMAALAGGHSELPAEFEYEYEFYSYNVFQSPFSSAYSTLVIGRMTALPAAKPVTRTFATVSWRGFCAWPSPVYITKRSIPFTLQPIDGCLSAMRAGSIPLAPPRAKLSASVGLST